jgi:hypothetical protein
MLFFLAFQKYPIQFDSLENDLKQNLVSCILAVVSFAMSFIFPKLLFVRSPAFKKLSRSSTDDQIIITSFVPFLMRLAFAESVSLAGFLAAENSKNTAAIIPFSAAAMFIFIINFPTIDYFRKQIPNMTNFPGL